MAVITMKQLLDAGVHFGHQTRRWNPKMKRFIHGDRNGIYIIDLNQTLERLEDAYAYVRDLVAGGGTILFVGTKRQAQDSIQGYAEKCGMPYVNQRWLGGMLTNFQTIQKRVDKMKEYQRMRDSGEFEAMPKKEALMISRELEKLERNLGGIRMLEKAPNAVFVLDTKLEHTAVTEANKLGLPLVAVVDTNCDPDLVDYVIPGNDDAIRAGDLMCRVIADAVAEGHFIRSKRAEATGAPQESSGARSTEEQAAVDAAQADARAAAAAAAAEREARVAAAAGVANDTASPSSAPADGSEADQAAQAAVAAADAEVGEAPAPEVETEPLVPVESSPDADLIAPEASAAVTADAASSPPEPVSPAAETTESQDAAAETTAADDPAPESSTADDATAGSEVAGTEPATGSEVAETEPDASEEPDASADAPYGEGSHAPTADGDMPEGFPIKGNADSMKFHQPDGQWYEATVAEVWFATPEAAAAAGFAEAGS